MAHALCNHAVVRAHTREPPSNLTIRMLLATSFVCLDCTLQTSTTPANMCMLQVLSEQREMLGGELRDVFDLHPAQVCVQARMLLVARFSVARH